MDATKDYTSKLQNKCLSFLLSDLAKATSVLIEGSAEAIKVELHIFSRLSYLSEVNGQSKACRTYTSDPEFLTSLFLLLDKGSPRIQKIVMELLGTVAPRTSVGIVNQAVEEMNLF